MTKLLLHPSITVLHVSTSLHSTKYENPVFCAECGEISDILGCYAGPEGEEDDIQCDHCGSTEMFDAASLLDLLRLRGSDTV